MTDKAPTLAEVRRMVRLAEDGFSLNWILGLQESIDDLMGPVTKMQDRLSDLKEKLYSNDIDLSPRARREVYASLRHIIIFNSEAERERQAFSEVGLGNCVESPGDCIKELKTALRAVSNRT